jgi:hypothetical protein
MLLCDEIIKNIIDYCDIPLLFSFTINKTFTQYINDKDWKKIWVELCKNKKCVLNEFEKKTTNTSDNEYKMVVKLAGFTGCMICNKKNNRKVWWEFSIRCCMECLSKKTIGEWEFEKKIPKEAYSHLSYSSKQMYNRYFGNYIIKFYWKKTINELLLLYPPEPVMPNNTITLKPLNPPKIKKIPNELDIAKQKQRKIDIDNICLSNNISLEYASTMSMTYKENIMKMSKLQSKNFIDTKIPEIKKEIEFVKEKEREKMELLKKIELEKMNRKTEMIEKQKIQNELYLMYKEDTKKYLMNKIIKRNKKIILTFQVKNVMCELCNNNRQFSLLGLRDHQKDVHKIVNNFY